MKEKKNIDRLFQEKFKDFEAAPPAQNWKSIEHKLQENKGKKVIPFWWYRIVGAAAVLAIAFLVYNYTQENPKTNVVKSPEQIDIENIKNNDKPFTNSNKNEEKELINQQNSITEGSTSVKETPQTLSGSADKNPNIKSSTDKKANSNRDNQRNTIVETKTSSSTKKDRGLASTNQKNNKTQAEESPLKAFSFKNENSESINKNTKLIAENPQPTSTEGENISKSNDDTSSSFENETNGIAEEETTEEDNKKSLVEVANQIAENKQEENEEREEDSDEKEKDPSFSKWLIKPNVSPIYYGSLEGSNNLDESLANRRHDGDISAAYGVNLAYSLSEKLKIRSGVSKINVSYNVGDVFFTTSPSGNTLQAISNGDPNNNIQVKAIPTDYSNLEVRRGELALEANGSLNQQIGYIEVPLEIEYALLDKKFGINVIGGASTLFLNKNNVYIQNLNNEISLGGANNLNSLSFTTNVGLGFNYELSKKFDLNLEPTFKYQINSFSNEINTFKPYIFGVYTGFSFKF